MNKTDELLTPKKRIERTLPVNLDKADNEDFDSAVSYETYDSFLRFVGKAHISPDSVIYRGAILDRQSLYSPEFSNYYQTRHLAKKLLFARKRSLNSANNALLATDQESSGHFHWLTEVLPRLWQIRKQSNEFVLLLPDTEYVRTIGVESLELLKFEFKDIVFMQKNEFYKVENLYHISKLSHTGQMNDDVMRELREVFISGKKTGERKIYISRSGNSRRNVLNENELIAMLSDHHFEVFYGEEMNLSEQIDYFVNSDTIVGIHGAGLSNCLFMKPGKIVELKKKEPNYGYWHLAGSLGHAYYYYHGAPDSDLSLIGQGSNLTIDINKFEKSIIELI